MAMNTAGSHGTATRLLMLSSLVEIPPFSSKRVRKLSGSNDG